MSSPRTLTEGLTALFFGTIISIVFLFVYGITTGRMLTSFMGAGLYDRVPEWQFYNSVLTLESIIYTTAALPFLIGLIVFILSAIKRQGQDIEQQVQSNEFDFTQEEF